PTINATSNKYNILVSSLNATTGILKQTDLLTSDNTNGFGTDIALDATNSKLVWFGGTSGGDLMRCNLDGSNVQSISSGYIVYGTGVATGGGYIFVSDYYGAALLRSDLDGSNMTYISGGANQANDIGTLTDIEYYNNKIYYVNQPNYSGNYVIRQADADGTSNTDLYSTANAVYGLAVSGGNIYWTESDNSGNCYVKTKPLSGGSVTTLATENGRVYTDVFVDAAHSLIYITDADIATNSQGTVKTIPLAGGTPSLALVLDAAAPSIVFAASAATLPVQFVNVSARPADNGNLVEWQVGTEDNVARYSVEHSSDGRSFAEAGSVPASGKSHYSYTDRHPYDGVTYYRIKETDNDEKVLYSNIVKVSNAYGNAGINVYPNAVTNHVFALQQNNLPAGTYALRLFNAMGQPVFSKTIQHAGGSAVQQVVLPASLAAGVYRLTLGD
ncbi:MAG: hypothetical protein JST39_11405, partial [Bacteroidetes bacterium]|nr:hypothetical protein [Bacteroidota bacterium]